MAGAGTTFSIRQADVSVRFLELLLRPLQAMTAEPAVLFLAALGLMLFHSPDFSFYSIDRVVFGLLVFVVFLRQCVLRQPLWVVGPVTWPMLGLVTLALLGALKQADSAEAWSLFAAKWFVPFVLYHLATIVFEDPASLRKFESFTWVVLAYLTFIAVCFLAGGKELIFPRYILDEGLGIHADRARGPFLQAVANGVALNLLAVIALDSFRRKRLTGCLAALLWITLPLAVMATRTRAVWLSFAGTILVLMFYSPSRRVRRTCLSLALAGSTALLLAYAFSPSQNNPLSDRLGERSPVDFRMAVYGAGWDMFQEKPILGWDTAGMQAELSRRISEFHQREFYFHNTYLEVLVRHGLLGLGLYGWLMVRLFRIGRKPMGATLPNHGGFLDEDFRSIWPLFLLVYFVNGALVVMNYQFVNGLVFTIAGMLTAQNRRLTAVSSDSRAS